MAASPSSPSGRHATRSRAARLGVTSVVPYVLLGAGLWIALYESGVNPTLAGVVLGLMAPAVPLRRSPTAAIEARQTLSEADHKPDEDAEAYWIATEGMAKLAVSPLDRIETSLHPWTSRIVVPTFALANAGIEISAATLSETVTSPLGLGVLLGLVVGKPLGIGAAIYAAARARIGRLPDGVSPRMILGVAALAGVGFTVALVIAELAFVSPRDVEAAKLAVLLASVLASVFGAVILRSANPPAARTSRRHSR